MAHKITHSLRSIADHIGAKLIGEGTLEISGLATLQDAQQNQISFLANKNYEKYLRQTKAGAVIVPPEFEETCPGNALILENSYVGYAKVSQLFDPRALEQAQIHPSAVVDPTAQLDASVSVGPNAVIAAGVVLAEGVRIGAGTVVGEDTKVGAHSCLYANVTIYHGVTIGKKVTIHGGTVVGSDGFGFARDKAGWVKISQLGGVVIEDCVEIGANTVIDRGAIGDTLIKYDAKLDNLIQIAHNCEVGEHTVIAGCSGVSGSTKIGKNCMLGGGSRVAGHLEIADNVHLTGMAMTTRSLKEPGVYSSGTSIDTNLNWRKSVARFRQLDDMARRLKAVEKQLEQD